MTVSIFSLLRHVRIAESEPYCHFGMFVASHSQRVSLIVIPFCLCVCRSLRDLQPATIDRSEPNLVSRSSDPCKPFWIP